MTQKHTHTPWTLGKGTVRIRNAENVLVAECYTTGNSIRYPIKEEREANAEFIVHACNAHAKLVEALKDIRKAIEPTEEWNGSETMITTDYVKSLDAALSEIYQIADGAIGEALQQLKENDNAE
jgi:queuine/archaeosine tRNA-ribosyltransferase